ncbi:MAG: DUF4870 domain-containing protein [Dermatophilaceae bacterium]
MSDITPRPEPAPNDPTAPLPSPPADPVPDLEVPAADAPPPTIDPPPAVDAGTAYPPPAQSYPPPAQSYPQQPPAQPYPPPQPAQSYPPQQPAQSYPPQQPAQSYPPQQQPYSPTAAPMDPTQERQWGMLAHIIGGVGFATTAVGGFVGTLVVYLMYKDRGPFVRAHAANSLNVQITTFIGLVIGFITAFFIIGFFILIAVAIWTVVVHIIGAIKANNGEWYDPPLTIKFVS